MANKDKFRSEHIKQLLSELRVLVEDDDKFRKASLPKGSDKSAWSTRAIKLSDVALSSGSPKSSDKAVDANDDAADGTSDPKIKALHKGLAANHKRLKAFMRGDHRK